MAKTQTKRKPGVDGELDVQVNGGSVSVTIGLPKLTIGYSNATFIVGADRPLNGRKPKVVLQEILDDLEGFWLEKRDRVVSDLMAFAEKKKEDAKHADR